MRQPYECVVPALFPNDQSRNESLTLSFVCVRTRLRACVCMCVSALLVDQIEYSGTSQVTVTRMLS